MNQVNSATASVYERYALKPETSEPNKNLGQEEFLKLMTTQLSNQDPFAPMENGEFLSQMAQFGTVSGIKELQDSFGALAGALQSNRALQASVMVGKEVLVASNRAELSEQNELRGAVALPVSVGNLKVRISDANGQLLKEISLGNLQAGTHDFDWDGITAQGKPAPAGVYYLSAEAEYGGKSEAFEVLTAANVDSVTMGQGFSDLTLNLAGLGETSLSQVRQIR